MDLSDLRDRDQLAGRLLELVIQPLFSLGLQLQAITGLTQHAEVARRLDAAIADLDHLIETVRIGAFSPDHPRHREPPTPSPSASGVEFDKRVKRSDGSASTEPTHPSRDSRARHPTPQR